MALSHSPSIATGNLMLYLDAANLKSYKGEPTTNIISNGDFSNGTTSWSTYASPISVVTRYDVPSALNMAKTVLRCDTLSTAHGGGNYGGASYNVSMTSGLVYTVSYYARSLSGNMNLVFNFQSGSGDSNNLSHSNTITSSWQKFSYSATLNTAKPIMYIWNQNVASGIFEITEIQVEQKSSATTFVNGTRGTTVATGGGWADISGKSNHGEMINGAGVYSSTDQGSINLDGSDDYVRVSYNASSMDFSLAQTVCMWLKPLTGATAFRRNPYAQAYGGPGTITHETGGDFTYYFGTNGGDGSPYVGRGSGFTVAVNELAFITVSRNQGTNTSKWYKNGSLLTTADAGGYATTTNGTSNIIIGAGYVTSFLGHIYNVSVYNRTLTDAEVLQNFNALRGRYGI